MVKLMVFIFLQNVGYISDFSYIENYKNDVVLSLTYGLPSYVNLDPYVINICT